MPENTFGFEPMVAPSGPVRQINAFGYDALQTKTARVLEHRWAVLIEMLAVSNERRGRKSGRNLLQ